MKQDALTLLETAQAQARFYSFLVLMFCGAIAIAITFSIPFPFSRHPWMQEVLGLSGIVNAFFFIVIAYRMERMSLPAAFAGLGLVLNEIILIAHEFWIFYHAKNEFGYKFFLLTSSLILIIGLIVFMMGIRVVYQYRWIQANEKIEKGTIHTGEYIPFFVSVIVYLSLYAAIYVVLHSNLGEGLRYGMLKILAAIATFGALSGVGYEIAEWTKTKKKKILCWVKSLTHVLTLAALLLILYRNMPVQSVLL
jgi:hypothetical protein